MSCVYWEPKSKIRTLFCMGKNSNSRDFQKQVLGIFITSLLTLYK